MTSAPRIDQRLHRLIDDASPDTSAADLTRSVGDAAAALGLARPSYERVRILLRASRDRRAGVTNLEVLTDVFVWQTRPAYDLEHRLYGEPLPYRRAAKNEPRNPRK
jgi:hypothetical protein